MLMMHYYYILIHRFQPLLIIPGIILICFNYTQLYIIQ